MSEVEFPKHLREDQPMLPRVELSQPKGAFFNLPEPKDEDNDFKPLLSWQKIYKPLEYDKNPSFNYTNPDTKVNYNIQSLSNYFENSFS